MWISVAQQGDESHKMYADSLASRGRILEDGLLSLCTYVCMCACICILPPDDYSN